jgi:hypothetical protein
MRMPLLNKEKNRSRMVIFRLTQEEYDSLRSACVAANGRSISDYMRSELLALAHTDPRGQATESRFSEIDRKLDELHALIKEVSERIVCGACPRDSQN